MTQFVWSADGKTLLGRTETELLAGKFYMRVFPAEGQPWWVQPELPFDET